MRLLGRATITVDTAASVAEKHTAAGGARQPRAGADRAGVARRRAGARRPSDRRRPPRPISTRWHWHGVDPRAFRRLLRVRLGLAALIGAASYGAAHRWAVAIGLAAAAALTAQAWVAARFTAFAWSGDTLCFRSATATRHVTLVRAGRPRWSASSNRRSIGAGAWPRVRVDTAGAATGGHHVHIRWLPADVADALYARLRHAAAP